MACMALFGLLLGECYWNVIGSQKLQVFNFLKIIIITGQKGQIKHYCCFISFRARFFPHKKDFDAFSLK